MGGWISDGSAHSHMLARHWRHLPVVALLPAAGWSLASPLPHHCCSSPCNASLHLLLSMSSVHVLPDLYCPVPPPGCTAAGTSMTTCCATAARAWTRCWTEIQPLASCSCAASSAPPRAPCQPSRRGTRHARCRARASRRDKVLVRTCVGRQWLMPPLPVGAACGPALPNGTQPFTAVGCAASTQLLCLGSCLLCRCCRPFPAHALHAVSATLPAASQHSG